VQGDNMWGTNFGTLKVHTWGEFFWQPFCWPFHNSKP
jgi:hypothetical protein